MLKPSKVTVEQWKKVAKAIAYSFVSGFLGTFVLSPELNQVDRRFLIASVISGINAVLVTVKQLFTQP